jgi:predicted phosphodiesterase
MIIGLISDTHSLVRPEVFEALKDVDLILHAGDVGGRAVLDELRGIAPVRAVFGNTDIPGDPQLDPAIDLVRSTCRTATNSAAPHPPGSSSAIAPTSSCTATRTEH